MNIEKMMKIFDDARKSGAGNLNIGKMLNKLEQFNDIDEICFTNQKFFDGSWDSYRGYYEDMYLGFSYEDQGFSTVGKIKDVLSKALDAGEMYGYKGGEYSVNNNTLVWLSSYGHTGDMIVDIQKINDQIFIITKEDE